MKDRNNQMFMPFPNQQFIPNMPFIQGEMDNKIAALERMVQRLDARVSKLEGNQGLYNNEYNTSLKDTYNQNIYPNAMHMM